MTIERLYELFVKNNTRHGDGITPSWMFKRDYNDMSFEEAFNIYINRIGRFKDAIEKVRRFENFLIKEGCDPIKSNVSESRYYFYKGIKYRFSGHVYPTGSMTNEILGIVDLAADPELINNINF